MGFPVRLGWQVMGSIGQPHRWLNGSRWNRPNRRTLVPLALPSGQRTALATRTTQRLQTQASASTPRNLFPGLLQRPLRPNGL